MTICVLLDGSIINVGPWDYRLQESFVDDLEHPYYDDGGVVVAYRQIPGPVLVTNPLPDGAVTQDVELAWTADERIVFATDPLAERPYDPDPLG